MVTVSLVSVTLHLKKCRTIYSIIFINHVSEKRKLDDKESLTNAILKKRNWFFKIQQRDIADKYVKEAVEQGLKESDAWDVIDKLRGDQHPEEPHILFMDSKFQPFINQLFKMSYQKIWFSISNEILMQ